jgi:teichuronic acid biosynthesis glycosyltransferase TuaG
MILNASKSDSVSIVCACYNSEDTIKETIISVLNQDYVNWEMFIIDDNSKDSSVDIIQSYLNDERINLLRNSQNLGSGPTRNKGISAAQGRYITFIDSDDLWESNFLTKHIEYQKKNRCAFTYGSYNRVDNDLKPILPPYIVPRKVSYTDLLKSGHISCLTAFIDISVLGKIYMSEIRQRQDYLFFLQYIKRSKSAHGIPGVLATYRMRPNSLSRNKYQAIRMIWIVYRKYEKLRLVYSIYLILLYSFKGKLKYNRFYQKIRNKNLKSEKI